MQWKGIPKVRKGSRPTPDDPSPSNQIALEYANGITVISTGNPTPRVLREYAEAVTANPESAELHLNYALVLRSAGDLGAAIREIRRAIALDPDSHFAHGTLADILDKRGEIEESIAEHRTALRLIQEDRELDREQGEAIARWGLGEVLRRSGRAAEAREQLEAAVSIQRAALSHGVASMQLLGQLEDALRNCR